MNKERKYKADREQRNILQDNGKKRKAKVEKDWVEEN